MSKRLLLRGIWSLGLILLLVGLVSVGIGAKGCERAFNLDDDDDDVIITGSSAAVTAPSNLTANPISATAVTLTWIDNSNSETGFKIERKTGAGGTYAQITTVDADIMIYTDTSLTPTTLFYYRVKGYNALSESSYSNEAGTTTYGIWTTTNPAGAPSLRFQHTAVWTGTEMIIWGGWSDIGAYITDGAVYSPTGNSWVATAATTLNGRIDHTAIWTGTEMIVWGGDVYDAANDEVIYFNTGGIYDPTGGGSWTLTLNDETTPVSRSGHTAVWTGNWMIIHGGYDGSQLKSTVAFEPTGNWWPFYPPDAPNARQWHTAVWTGSTGTESWRKKMIVWGGYDGSYLNTGDVYDMETGIWSSLPTDDVPSGRCHHTVVWTGSKMIVWGGYDGIEYLNTGGVYDPDSNTWTPMSTTNAPVGRMDHTAIWTGSKMVVWGGGGAPGFNTGGVYYPETNTWGEISTTNAPSQRGKHTAVWTGSEMIIWGGWDGVDFFNTGGCYTAQ